MKIIFLDFDGVIRLAKAENGKIKSWFCPERMCRVADLASSTNAKIVISSDWREGYGYHGIIDLLEPHLDRSMLHSDWSTPLLRLSDPAILIPRGAEIISWLYRNGPVEKFVILDDLDHSNFPLMEESLIHCMSESGYTESEHEAALSILMG